jgi:3-phenylpropionate/trans-cinnamate dioxygenase ferredoxin subunit
MPLRLIARVDDIPAGAARFFSLDHRSVVIANCGGEFFAVDGVCPHKGFELDGAQLWDCRIECPWHRYQYDVRTGENCFPQSVYRGDLPEPVQPIATCRVELRGSEIWVELE